ncbi:tannase and feruloyl esterase [Podospora didyma]|uniref:Carboxylic ester hydrolase n=1 Tax=Podospora didyma TaxID=330526 RepID=A0AAE0U0K5_9PEZI|nr:tannase and feruloyl esterase [Podospora didyma]
MSISSCVPATFGTPTILGTQILSLEANLVTNYSTPAPIPAVYRFTQPAIEVQNVTFCNVTVSYTHTGQDDELAVEGWLPVDWNGRFQAVGGGGWAAGRVPFTYAAMGGAIAEGFATVTTDAGLGNATGLESGPWALLSPGNVNLYNLQDFGSVSLNEQAIIGKSLIASYYGKGPTYSYWNGCSQGGRQGMMLAQRYPDAYDGIAAGAPGIYWTEIPPAAIWPQHFMNTEKAFPYACELEAITAGAVAACDGLDGVLDGIITEVDACLASFDPFQLVGSSVSNCSDVGGKTQDITVAAASVANASWHGSPQWFGYSPGADLTHSTADPGTPNTQPGPASTNCTTGTCVGVPNELWLQWLRVFSAKGDPSFNFTTLTRAEYDRLAHVGAQEYRSSIRTDDPDLSAFRAAGGKLVSFHGLSDNMIPWQGTRQYYDAVAARVPDVHGFYRHYEVPGLGHCSGGPSGQPDSLFAQLRAWVENGTAPAESPIKVTLQNGTVQNRVLCPYPQKARWQAAGWYCSSSVSSSAASSPKSGFKE